MRNRAPRILENLLERRAVRRWDRLIEATRTAGPARLRRLKRFADTIAPRVNAIDTITRERLSSAKNGNAFKGLPVTTDWADHPDIWDRAMLRGGLIARKSPTRLDDRVAVFHDCKTPSLTVRQVQEPYADGQSRRGLQFDIYDFDGSFLSVVIQAADGMVSGLSNNHVLRVTANISSERHIHANLRLNLKHGPNTEQIEKALDVSGRVAKAEFDLAYLTFNETRVGQIWFDLFLDSDPMNMIRIHSLTLSRHTRADI